MHRQSLKALLISTCVVSAIAFGSSVTIPYNFFSGTPARAAEVNANFAAVKSAVDDNDARITAITAAPAYTAPTFLTGWSNVGAGWMPAGYTKDALGVVHLRGLIKKSGGTGNIFQLPTGYRPLAAVQFPARCGDSTMCAVIVNANGNVDFYPGPNSSAAGSLTLDGIYFDPR